MKNKRLQVYEKLRSFAKKQLELYKAEDDEKSEERFRGSTDIEPMGYFLDQMIELNKYIVTHTSSLDPQDKWSGNLYVSSYFYRPFLTRKLIEKLLKYDIEYEFYEIYCLSKKNIKYKLIHRHHLIDGHLRILVMNMMMGVNYAYDLKKPMIEDDIKRYRPDVIKMRSYIEEHKDFKNLIVSLQSKRNFLQTYDSLSKSDMIMIKDFALVFDLLDNEADEPELDYITVNFLDIPSVMEGFNNGSIIGADFWYSKDPTDRSLYLILIDIFHHLSQN